jgi:hypothetical protein
VADGVPTLVDDDTVRIDTDSGAPWSYDGLVAWDADGTDLPASMAVDGSTIELRVDTTGATYPVTIDPIVSGTAIVFTPQAASDRVFGAFGGGLGGAEATSSCPAGTLLVGVTVYLRDVAVTTEDWIRAVSPRCRTAALNIDAKVELVGTLITAVPSLGNQAAAAGATVSSDCPEPDQVVVGLAAEAGGLIDRLAIRCAPLESDGSVGPVEFQSPYFGGTSTGVSQVGPRAAVVCKDAPATTSTPSGCSAWRCRSATRLRRRRIRRSRS